MESTFKEFKPDAGQELRAEWAMLRNALESLDTAHRRIKNLNHTITTARERFDVLDQALRDGGGK